MHCNYLQLGYWWSGGLCAGGCGLDQLVSSCAGCLTIGETGTPFDQCHVFVPVWCLGAYAGAKPLLSLVERCQGFASLVLLKAVRVGQL